jgi:hypothetical protein
MMASAIGWCSGASWSLLVINGSRAMVVSLLASG